MIRKLGGRKLVLGFVVMTIGITIDLTFGLGSNLLTLLIFVASGFFIGNVGEHACEAAKERGRSKGGIPLEEAANALKEVHKNLELISETENNVTQKVDNLTKISQGNLEAMNTMLSVMRGGK